MCYHQVYILHTGVLPATKGSHHNLLNPLQAGYFHKQILGSLIHNEGTCEADASELPDNLEDILEDSLGDMFFQYYAGSGCYRHSQVVNNTLERYKSICLSRKA